MGLVPHRGRILSRVESDRTRLPRADSGLVGIPMLFRTGGLRFGWADSDASSPPCFWAPAPLPQNHGARSPRAGTGTVSFSTASKNTVLLFLAIRPFYVSSHVALTIIDSPPTPVKKNKKSTHFPNISYVEYQFRGCARWSFTWREERERESKPCIVSSSTATIVAIYISLPTDGLIQVRGWPWRGYSPSAVATAEDATAFNVFYRATATIRGCPGTHAVIDSSSVVHRDQTTASETAAMANKIAW